MLFNVRHGHAHFIDEKAGVSGDKAIYPRSHGWDNSRMGTQSQLALEPTFFLQELRASLGRCGWDVTVMLSFGLWDVPELGAICGPGRQEQHVPIRGKGQGLDTSRFWKPS